MTIVTKRGDTGQTDLAGQVRTSKTNPRVECYGTVDELISQLGFTRSICEDKGVQKRVKSIQRALFRIGSSLATDPTGTAEPPKVTEDLVGQLDAEIRQIESNGTVAADWSIPGGDRSGAAMDVARTVCRRAERRVVALIEAGEAVDPQILAYLNRLSDLLWLMGRQLESTAGADSRLREKGDAGKPWSAAW